MPSDESTKNSSPTPKSTPGPGPSTSGTSSKPTSPKKDSELFNFDPSTVEDATIEEIADRLKGIVARNRKARSLLAVDEQRALEEEAKKPKRKKKPLMEREL